jgi:hypothetical protein
MPAANIETLYRCEEVLEAAAKTILSSNASLTAFRQLDTGNVTAPWCAVQVSGISATGAQHYDTAGFTWDSGFTAQLSVVVATNRVKEGGSSTHTATVAKVRRYICDLTKWTDVALPYHKVWSATNSGSQPTVDENDRLDMTTLTFTLQFLIRDDAWPV